MKRWHEYFVFFKLCFFAVFFFVPVVSQGTYLSPLRAFHSVPILKHKRTMIKMDLNVFLYLFSSHNVGSFIIRCSHFWCHSERTYWKYFTKYSGYFKDLGKIYLKKGQIQKGQILHDCRMHVSIENTVDKTKTIITLMPWL